MRRALRDADPAKVAEWVKAGHVWQQSIVRSSTVDQYIDGFPWPVTEEFLDAVLNNIKLMRKELETGR